MLLTGEAVAAEKLFGSFVHRLGDVASAFEWARELSQLAPLTIQAHKMALESMLGDGAAASFSVAEVEAARLAAWASADADEGRRAFMEKRPPRFEGR